MAEILKGNAVTAAINERTAAAVEELKAYGVMPTLCILRVGERPDDLSYENGAVKRAAAVGVEVVKRAFPIDVTEDELIKAINEINEPPSA